MCVCVVYVCVYRYICLSLSLYIKGRVWVFWFTFLGSLVEFSLTSEPFVLIFILNFVWKRKKGVYKEENIEEKNEDEFRNKGTVIKMELQGGDFTDVDTDDERENLTMIF